MYLGNGFRLDGFFDGVSFTVIGLPKFLLDTLGNEADISYEGNLVLPRHTLHFHSQGCLLASRKTESTEHV